MTKLNDIYEPVYVIGGNGLSDSTLRGMKKSDLIYLLYLAQLNYDSLMERTKNLQQLVLKYDKERKNEE